MVISARPPYRLKTMKNVWKIQVNIETIFCFTVTYVPTTQCRNDVEGSLGLRHGHRSGRKDECVNWGT